MCTVSILVFLQTVHVWEGRKYDVTDMQSSVLLRRASLAEALQVQRWVSTIQQGLGATILPLLNEAKASKEAPAPEGTDYCRALCFLTDDGNLLTARQALLEELRLHPQHRDARRLLNDVDARVRPLLIPPIEVKKEYPLFALLCDAVLDHTMLTWPRLLHLHRGATQLAHHSDSDGGHVVECGTAGGGSAVLMAVTLAECEDERHQRRCGPSSVYRKVFALDTFAGMPPPSPSDRLVSTSSTSAKVEAAATSWSTGTCAAPEHQVKQLAIRFGVADRLITIPGLFAETITGNLLPHPSIAMNGIALLHLDADWYDSTRDVLQNVVPVMRRGQRNKNAAPHHSGNGVFRRFVQVDDYLYWHGCRTAVDEYLLSGEAEQPSTAPTLEPIDNSAVFFYV